MKSIILASVALLWAAIIFAQGVRKPIPRTQSLVIDLSDSATRESLMKGLEQEKKFNAEAKFNKGLLQDNINKVETAAFRITPNINSGKTVVDLIDDKGNTIFREVTELTDYADVSGILNTALGGLDVGTGKKQAYLSSASNLLDGIFADVGKELDAVHPVGHLHMRDSVTVKLEYSYATDTTSKRKEKAKESPASAGTQEDPCEATSTARTTKTGKKTETATTRLKKIPSKYGFIELSAKVKSITLEYYKGFIRDIRVFLTVDSVESLDIFYQFKNGADSLCLHYTYPEGTGRLGDAFQFTNIYSIGAAKKSAYEKINNIKLFDNQLSKSIFLEKFLSAFPEFKELPDFEFGNVSINLGEVLYFDHRIAPNQLNVAPADACIQLTRSDSAAVLAKEKSSELINAYVYSDVGGLAGVVPNGNLQLELDRDFSLINYRRQIFSTPRLGWGILNNINLSYQLLSVADRLKVPVTFINKAGKLSGQLADAVLGNQADTGDVQRTLTPVQAQQYANNSFSMGVDVLTVEAQDMASEFYARFNLSFSALNVLPNVSLDSIDDINLDTQLFERINFTTLGLGLAWRTFNDTRLNMEMAYRFDYTKLIPTTTDDIQNLFLVHSPTRFSSNKRNRRLRSGTFRVALIGNFGKANFIARVSYTHGVGKRSLAFWRTEIGIRKAINFTTSTTAFSEAMDKKLKAAKF